jgi:hypothetical protein
MKLDAKAPRANLSATARAYLANLGIKNPDADASIAGLIWMHALAIGYSPAYLSENADGIRQDWPRIPLPDTKEALLASAALGKQIAAILDTETPFEVAPASCRPRERAGQRSPLQRIAVFMLGEKRPLRVEDEKDLLSDLSLTAGWGHGGNGGVTMPGKGKLIEREYSVQERAGMDEALKLFGERTCDVYLNEMAYWSNIPLRAWDYTIGGYQVIKKWLSYRERKLLGRHLSKQEVRYVTEMAYRIAAILLLEAALDSNYLNVKEHAYRWPHGGN